MDRIDFEPPAFAKCSCCEGTIVSLTRFVEAEGRTAAVYFVKFSDAHPGVAQLAIGIGDWRDEAVAERDRAAFAFALTRIGEDFNIAAIDFAASPWRDTLLLGRPLDRLQALAHPNLGKVHEIANAMAGHDAAVKGFFGLG